MEFGVLIILMFISPIFAVMMSLIGLYSGKKWKTHIFILSLFLAIMAFNYIPTVESDLVRYFEYVKRYGSYSINEIFEQFRSGRQFFISFVLLCRGTSKMGNEHFLPAIVVLIVFYITLYITYKFCEINQYSYKFAFEYSCLILLALSFYNVTNNIRNVLAFSMIALAVFRDVYQKKRNMITFLLYVVPIFLHVSVLIMIALRIILRLSGKIKSIALFFVVFAFPILSFFDSTVSSLNENLFIIKFVKIFILKAIGYFSHSDADWAITASKSGSILMTKILYILYVFLFFLILILQLRRMNKDKYEVHNKNDLEEYINYIFYVCLMTFACIPMIMPEYWRFASMVLIMGGPIFVVSRQEKTIQFSRIKINLNHFLYIIAIGCFCLWCRDMWMYSDVKEMISNTVLFSPIFRNLI